MDDVTPTWRDTPEFVPPIEGGIPIRVYDGDTIWVASKLPWSDPELSQKWFKFNIRLRGIDTPEIRGGNDDEKKAARTARDYLKNIILGKYVVLKNVVNESKWGRLIADVYVDDQDVVKLMLNSNMGVPYDGGSKSVPESWLDYQAGRPTEIQRK